MAVVKANAYGHGLDVTAPVIATEADAFGVYEVAEALRLRELGVTQPIHLLGAVGPREFDGALAARATLAVWDTGGWARDLFAAARRRDATVNVQLKIDSGLSRLGVNTAAQVHALRDAYSAAPEIRLTGAYSHIAAAEELDSRFTLDQLDAFCAAVPAGTVPERHIAASAAAMVWPQTRLDMIRTGIAMYGLWPSPAIEHRMRDRLQLRPALRWLTQLVAIREVAADTPVGYGATYRPPVATRVGILPIGYAEGLPRVLSNSGEVLIDGARCPIIGRICMNMTFVDLGPAPQAQAGDTVTLIGRDGDGVIGADDIAHLAQTINYEIVARLPASVPRRLVCDAPDAAQL